MSDETRTFEEDFAEAKRMLAERFDGSCWRDGESVPIAADEEVYVSLASFGDYRVTCLASHLVDVVFSAAEGEVRADGSFVGSECAVTRVVPVNNPARALCEGAMTYGLDDQYLVHASSGLNIWLDHGLTELALHYSANGVGHEYFPETPFDWMFLCVTGKLDPQALDGVFATYLYSLEESHSLAFAVERFPELSEEEFAALLPDGERLQGIGDLPLRPLYSPKLKEILGLYLEAAALPSPTFQILGYTRVVEYVSVIVEASLKKETDKVVGEISDAGIRTRLTELTKTRARAATDSELLTQAIGVVCDPVPLSGLAPSVLGELRAVTPANAVERRDGALKQLSRVAYATRNEIAHAKANYRRTGNECPPEQEEKFGALLRIVAQQAIAWLAAQSTDSWQSPSPATPPPRRQSRADRGSEVDADRATNHRRDRS